MDKYFLNVYHRPFFRALLRGMQAELRTLRRRELDAPPEHRGKARHARLLLAWSARAAGLAYAFRRGIPYRAVEEKTSTDPKHLVAAVAEAVAWLNPHTTVCIPHDAAAIAAWLSVPATPEMDARRADARMTEEVRRRARRQQAAGVAGRAG